MKKHLFRYSALAISVGLALGMVSVAGASSGTIGTTGPDSYNKIKQETKTKMMVVNNNHASVMNNVSQMAHSGDAEVEHNTTGGAATAGAATNTNAVTTSYMVQNCDNCGLAAVPASGSNTGTINTTGPDSYNKVEFETETLIMVKNTNDLTVNNNVEQRACSGEAEVEGNTTGGSATSGAATNTNTVTTTLNVSN